MSLAKRRLLESVRQEPRLSEEAVRKILEAIWSGTQLRCYVLRPPFGAAVYHDDSPLKETCLTQFTDPDSGGTRWAVEVWVGQGSRKWAYDFSTLELAEDFIEAECGRLGIPMKAVGA